MAQFWMDEKTAWRRRDAGGFFVKREKLMTSTQEVENSLSNFPCFAL
jgi:hypothetical protein